MTEQHAELIKIATAWLLSLKDGKSKQQMALVSSFDGKLTAQNINKLRVPGLVSEQKDVIHGLSVSPDADCPQPIITARPV